MAQAASLDVAWKVFLPYDWGAVAVALDSFGDGDATAANSILRDLRATNGSAQSVGLELDHGYDRVDKEPSWRLQEVYYGQSIPYERRPTNFHPAKIMPGRGPGGSRYGLRNFYGEDAILTFASAEEAREFAKGINLIDHDGRVTLKRGIMPELALRRLEREEIERALAGARRVGAPAGHIADLAAELELYDDLIDELEEDDGGAIPNRRKAPGRGGRVKVYEAGTVAKEMREVFTNRSVERVERLGFGWPAVMQAIGDSLAVAYGSDKWKTKDGRGRREVELYKHLAESRNRVLARPGVIHDHAAPEERWPVIGPKVRMTDVPMPSDFAVLGLFEGLDLKLYTAGTSRAPRFGPGDDGIVHVRVGHGYLGGSKIRWSEIDPARADEPFIFVYTRDGGVMFVVLGEELDIEKDGIVG